MPNDIEELNVKESRLELDYWLQHDVFVPVVDHCHYQCVIYRAAAHPYGSKKDTQHSSGLHDRIYHRWGGRSGRQVFRLMAIPASTHPIYRELKCCRLFCYSFHFCVYVSEVFDLELVPIAVRTSLVISYVGEPIFVSLDMYELVRWSYWASLLVLVGIAILMKGVVDLTQSSVLHFDVNRELVIDFKHRNKKKIR